MTDLPKKAMYRVKELADFFDVGESTVYRWIDFGMLEAEKYRGAIRVPRESVVQFREDHKMQPLE